MMLNPIIEPATLGQVANELRATVAAGVKDIACIAMSPIARNVAMNSSLARQGLVVLEAALGQVNQLVQQMQSIAERTQNIRVELLASAGMDWQSMAGQSFKTKAQRDAATAAELAATAEQIATQGRAAQQELLDRIATMREIITLVETRVHQATEAVC